MEAHKKGDIKTRVIGILCDNNVDEDSLNQFKKFWKKKAQVAKLLHRKAEK
jgi:phosphopantetheine adenylyltransferase